MKRKVIPITIVCVLAVVLAFQIVPYAFAHPSSQEGILAKSYHEEYEGYYVGGEDVGWSIDGGYYTNGTTLRQERVLIGMLDTAHPATAYLPQFPTAYIIPVVYAHTVKFPAISSLGRYF